MKHRRYHLSLLAVLAMIMMAGLARQAFAGLVTNNGALGLPPYTKLGIYGKLLSIVDSSGRALEFGNGGTDIASTSTIVLKPGNPSVTSQGLTFRSNGSTADVYVSGDLCLYNHGTSSEVCRHAISSASGTTWQVGAATGAWGAYNYLEPKQVTGVTPGVKLSGITNGSALTLNGTGYAQDLQAVNTSTNANALAVKITGDFVSNAGTIATLGDLYVNGRAVWHPQGYGLNSIKNDGAESRLPAENFGLDADLANGNQVTIEPASSCANSPDGYPHVACLCFLIKYTVNGSTDVTLSPPEKHCTDLANRPQ